MKNLALVSFVFLFSFAGIQERSIKDITSIIKNADGKYDVVCGDGSQEVVELHDVQMENLCPYVAPAVFDPNKVDILFVVDDSGSMGPHQDKLAKHAGLIVEKLKFRGYDFQIAVTTTDTTGKNNQYINNSGHEVLTEATPDLKEALAQNLAVGTAGSGTEKGFEQSVTALSQYLNGGFYRDGAKLHIVFFSDEGDQSTMDAQEYADFLKEHTELYAPEQRFEVTAINAFSKDCRDKVYSGGPPADKEADLVSLINGKAVSICDNHYDLF